MTRRITGILLLIIMIMASEARAAIVLSDNLAEVEASTEIATTTSWLTSSFATDGAAYLLDSVTLRMQLVSPTGTAKLQIYSNASNQPGVSLSTLTSPVDYSATLADNLFSSSPLLLLPDSTYWVVLSAEAGAFEWAWTLSNTGEGVGFQPSFGFSEDSGSTWQTFGTQPQMMNVTVLAIPEAGTVGLISMAAAFGLHRVVRRRQQSWF